MKSRKREMESLRQEVEALKREASKKETSADSNFEATAEVSLRVRLKLAAVSAGIGFLAGSGTVAILEIVTQS
ncbi:hypothetical protein APR11_003413 [Nocardia amikacinitolerans]|uniref:hypothetical protein n=1 Tax=Nocardia amikacinitolerans TaxID=756689 RepID=UPI0020A3E296|nr:hypothetical protein [Nocardia amikacinitolerans]MCP2296981.1 hypothetical protein [Nocardia amikacinitolerans]